MFEPRVFSDYESLSRHAAAMLVATVRRRPAALFCLAAGSTPRRAYELFIAEYSCNPAQFDQLRIIKLDEWGGLPLDDPATCEHFLRCTFVEPLQCHDRYIGYDSNPADPESECRRIADWLTRSDPIDCCVLGLGVNGHVGFNEPAQA